MGGILKYTRNLHIIGRTRYAHQTHNLEACVSILEVIAHPEGRGGGDIKLHMIRLFCLNTPTVSRTKTPTSPTPTITD